jgi:hypothetical protein
MADNVSEFVNVSKFVNVSERLEELGWVYPRSGMALLPVNIGTAESAEELRQASEAATVKKLLKAGQLPIEDIMNAGQRLPAIKNKHLEWTAPILCRHSDWKKPAVCAILRRHGPLAAIGGSQRERDRNSTLTSNR